VEDGSNALAGGGGWLTFNTGTGVFTGTPNAGGADRGQILITATADDGNGGTPAQTQFYIDVDTFTSQLGAGADNVMGTGDADVIHGGDGNDTIHGSDDHDRIYGGSGNDSLTGGNQNDVLYGGAGDDVFVLEDTFEGTDTMYGGLGTDTIYFSAGNAAVEFSSFSYAASSVEIIDGGAGNDEIWGSSAANNLDFTGVTITNVEMINGADGNDTITGSSAADAIDGGDGNDTLNGAGGADTLTGFTSADTFRFSDLTHSTIATPDLIADFENGNDTIHLQGMGFTTLADFEVFNFAGGITTLQDTDTNFTLTFTGDVTALLDNTDFIWV
jgi:Ca2+-binding RTX toxin-like protein